MLVKDFRIRLVYTDFGFVLKGMIIEKTIKEE